MFISLPHQFMSEKRTLIRNINPFGLRMPPDLRERLEQSAAANGRSLNAEIVHRLRLTFEPEDGDDTLSRLPTGPADGLPPWEELRSDVKRMQKDLMRVIQKFGLDAE